MDRAVRLIAHFAATTEPTRGFLIEEIAATRGEEIGDPRDGHSWGIAAKKAEAAGSIEKTGAFRRDQFGSPKTLWRRGPSA